MPKPIPSWKKNVDRALCVLNGVFGDSLATYKTGLALPMKFFQAPGQPMDLTRKAMSQWRDVSADRISILVHGSCGSEKGWVFKGSDGDNYGSLLQRDFGFVPFFVRYNSGLHISTNGRHLSSLLEKFFHCYPQTVQEMVMIGHSMGGLVLRSACYYAQKERKKWVKKVRKIFYIASPHLGTHLEKVGKLTTTIMNHIPNPFTKLFVTLGDLRSAGVKDLRHGYLIDQDWRGKGADDLFYRHKNSAPLLQRANHYLICGTLSKKQGSIWGRLVGDGLVHPASGTGTGWLASSAIPFLAEHSTIITGISHPHLQRSRRVYEQIKKWCN